ncbi:reductase [Basidiobolus meristosporus CBS 931.73]|uniref:peptide-methionine (S)-S-oxide reductase n=1 Tax=Basidiobolus meristosporus CBS 931.73 TaxID=1314790 RepID=A0A1Y1YEW8_9FUNG|nr:reductase [Basidiobolus meristosporus CBS 931.73]|eukprot:ORX96256.1 reductase [Basidiobolus meristosporus CBS 931.73]
MSTEKATYAAGCFWGVEKVFQKQFNHLGIQTEVGYTGGATDNPNYKQVCNGDTQHAEAIEITFDPKKVTYDALTEFFYRMHDPTTVDRQGPDVGTQYRSAIFYHSPAQKETAEKVTKEVQEKHFQGKRIATQIVPAQKFYSAEEYHQNYLSKNPHGYECPTHFLRW